MLSAPKPPLAYPIREMVPTLYLASTRGRMTSRKKDSWLVATVSASQVGRLNPSSTTTHSFLSWNFSSSQMTFVAPVALSACPNPASAGTATTVG